MELWGADFGVFDRLKLQFRVKDFVCIYFFFIWIHVACCSFVFHRIFFHILFFFLFFVLYVGLAKTSSFGERKKK